MDWSVADAKNRLSEVLNLVDTEEVQLIRRRNREYFVVSGETYRRLTGEQASAKDLILNGPGLEGVDLERDRSGDREVDL